MNGHEPTPPGFIPHEIIPDEPEEWPEANYLTNRYELLSYTLVAPSQVELSARVDCMLNFLETALQSFVR